MAVLIDYKGVEIHQADQIVLRDVNLHVENGEMIYMLGKVGSGKSSLLKTIYGALPIAAGSAQVLEYDMTRISVETDKLISYAIKDGVINKKDVEELVYRDGESKIYKMTDAIGRKNFDLALKILGELTEGGETPQRLLVSVYNYFRRLLHVAISDKTVTELANLLETSEYPVKIAKEQAKLFKVKSLKAAVDLLSDADYNFKRGKTDIDNAFYTTLFRIMVG